MKEKENELLLIQAFKEGNEKAFKKLFDKYHQKLYAYLFRLLDSKDDAEDIVQETFIKIWEKRSQFIEGYSFDAFLFKIAKNAFISLTRKKINQKVLEISPEMLAKPDGNDSESDLILNETREIIDKIINRLPKKRKEIFRLRRIENLSRKEISDKLGISIVTVDNQIMKANHYLKTELKKHSILLLIFLFL